MSKEIISDIEDGYAVWLEPTHLHFHSGGRVEVKALWGNRMQKDGTGNPENWQVLVTDPEGSKLEAEITYGEGMFAQIYFPAVEEGLYYALLENNVKTLNEVPYTQWAGLLIPVGHHVHGTGVVTGRGLEIVPSEFKEFHPGDTISSQVLLNGKPLPGVEVKITYHLYEGENYPYSEITGDDGKFYFTFDNKGHWMFSVTYKSDEEGHYTGTFVVPGVR